MTTFSEELRKAREAKNISLAEISRLTRINLKYLEAIDQGSFDVLPQTYIRAFLKEYAQAVGLSPVEILQKYDILVTGKYTGGQTSASTAGWSGGRMPPLQEPVHDAQHEATSEETLVKQRSMRTIVIIASIIVLCSLILAYIANYIWVGRSGPALRETPFSDVVREKENQKLPPPKADTIPALKESTAVAPPTHPAASDSLTLAIVTTDRVWMNIGRDSVRFESVLLGEKQSMTVRAKRRFTLTLGNAGGVLLKLNGKDLGELGKRGDVLRGIVITAAGITKPGIKQTGAKK
jgi:cytoskeletal protein RodZ